MKQYKVINRYTERDSNGNPLGRYVEAGEKVMLSDAEGERLVAANCVRLYADRDREQTEPTVGIMAEVEVETAMADPAPENRRRGRPRRRN